MSYLVLARKYRPQTFEQVCAQEHITTALSNALNMGRIAQAYLFTGPRGVGKTSLARIFAKSLNCVHGPTPYPCNECPNCRDITEGKSMDVIEIDAASNTGVDDVRELQKELIYQPVNSRYKIYIIDEVHMLSKAAFNALLKTLEEPPESVVFIFATTEPQKVLPTIVSRCQRYDFRRMSIESITGQLKTILAQEHLSAEDDALFFIAKKADGGMRDALSLLDQAISFGQQNITAEQVFSLFGILPFDAYVEIMQAVAKRNSTVTLEALHKILEAGNDLQEFVNGLLDFLRSLLLLKQGLDAPEIPHSFLDTMKELAETFSDADILYMLTYMVKAKTDLKNSGNPMLLAEMIFVKLSRLTRMVPVDQLLEAVRSTPVQAPRNREEDYSNVQEFVRHETIDKVKTSMVREAEEQKPKFDTFDGEVLKQHWDPLMKRIEKDHPVIRVYFADAETTAEGNEIRVTMKSKTAYDRLAKVANDLNRIASEYFGRTLYWKFVLQEEPKEEIIYEPKLEDIRRESPGLAEFIELTKSNFKPVNQ